MSLRDNFTRWYYTQFHADDMYHRMFETVENTPWHREANVGVHTNMVVQEYLDGALPEWNHLQLAGAVACVFHDVGKPSTLIVKENAERGKYNSFAGHEQVGARMWEDYACANWSLFSSMGLEYSDIYSVGWMVTHHLPFGLKKHQKLKNLGETVKQMHLQEVFPAVIWADQRGRTSDASHQRLTEVNLWIASFLKTWC